MDLGAKLQLTPEQGVEFVGLPRPAPDGVADLGRDRGADRALVVFVHDRRALDGELAAVVAAAGADRLTWVAYPKAGQLGTDLNRDSVAAVLRAAGVRPVRQVSVDDVWSALRFRPG